MITETLVTPVELERASNPFPGLRPFEFDENHLFFGREGQSKELLVKLSRTHFLAVVGTSGSGKSSLVRAGLLPALYGGHMGKSGSGWRIAVLRPGHNPIGNLAEALNKPGALEMEDAETGYVQTQVSLRRDGLGLAETVQQVRLKPHENLLVVVDQFEELFRFAQISQNEEFANEAAAFVKLLLEARRQSNIYIVLTMRSDYLGDCAQFLDLPEAINDGQYLIPRMTRDERRDAILGPLGIFGATITSGLVKQLLNDMGERPDKLPILQHALMRIWEKWREEGDESEPIDLRHYERCGGFADTLSRHANEAFDELPDERAREIAEKLFKCLTEKGADDRQTRRPTELGEICQITGATTDEVIAVIEVFRREGRSFLMPSPNVPLEPGCLIDISHESLISGWERLRRWVDEEADSRRLYKRLADNAILYRKEGPLRDPGLQATLDWRERERPSVAWASRHHASFSRLPRFAAKPKKERDAEIFGGAMALLDESRQLRDTDLAEKERQRRKRIRRKFIQISTAIGTIAFVVCLGFLLYALKQHDNAVKQRNYAMEQSDKAVREATINGHIRYAAIMNLAQQASQDYDFARANKLLKEFDKPEDAGLRGFEWFHLWREFHNERSTPLASQTEVLSVAYSADGQRAAAGRQDGSVMLWATAAEPWQVITAQPQHKGPVPAVAFSVEGLLATGGADGTVKIWSADTGRLLETLKHAGPVKAVAFTEDGKRLVSVADGAVNLWNVNKEALSFELQPPPRWHDSGSGLDIMCVAFSPDGRTLAVGGHSLLPSGRDTVRLWSIDRGQEIPFGKSLGDRILSVAFSHDGKLLATGGDGRAVRVWNLNTRAELILNGYGNGRAASSSRSPRSSMGHANTISSVRFSRDGKWLASGSWDGTVKLWSVAKLVEKGKESRKERWGSPESEIYKGHSDYVHAIAFSPKDEVLISGSRDGTLKTWNIREKPQEVPLDEEDPAVLSVAFHGTTLAIGRMGGTVLLRKVDAKEPFHVLQQRSKEVTSVSFSPDGKVLATADGYGKIALWDTGTWQEVRELNWGSTRIYSVSFSRDGKLIAAGGKHSDIQLWQVDTGRPLEPLRTEAKEIFSVAFSPASENTLAGGGTDGKLTLWDVNRGQPKAFDLSDTTLSVAFSPGGNILAVGTADGNVSLLDMLKPEKLATGRAHVTAVQSVVFSPDGKRLASGSDGGVVKLWDTTLVPSGTMVWQELIALDWRHINSMAFSPDSTLLVAGSPAAKVIGSERNNQAIKIWGAASPVEAGVK